jgi:predicted  nucleic acid-binding Zn-ribbon protein
VIKESRLYEEFLELEQRMRLLDRQLADALQRIRHSSSADAIERAKQEEKSLLTELDRLMTRMRAIEGQILQLHKTATRH